MAAADAAGGRQAYSYHGAGKGSLKRMGLRKTARPSYSVGTTYLGLWGGPRRFAGSYYGYGRGWGNLSREYSGHRGYRYVKHGGKRYARGGRGYRGGHNDAYHVGPVPPFYPNNIRRYHGGKYNRANRGYNGGYARDTSSGALIISLRSGNSGQVDKLAASGTTPKIEGDCNAGDYCTVRLGPYPDSPKIITLNTQNRDNGPR